jgi:uncharacterized membrane protein
MKISEFKVGIFNLLKRIIGGSGAILALTYTLGHIIIAMTCNYFITGAQLQLAAVDALVEPIINGFWFYILHNTWKRFQKGTKAHVGKT